MTDNHADSILPSVELADIVRLKEPYKGFAMGIVSEILDYSPDGAIRNVSLYLYNPDTQEVYLTPHGLPCFVDFPASAFVLYKRAADPGYEPLA